MVLSSNQEGGANVISEAITAGVPIIASNIPGNTGLLGKDYPGLYPVHDEQALSVLLNKVETDWDFLAQLQKACQNLQVRFTPEQEAAAWNGLINTLFY
jgi:glycosyltransferase involved in cell wall biosynthesis